VASGREAAELSPEAAAAVGAQTAYQLLRASNGPYRRDCSSTERSLFAFVVKGFGGFSSMPVLVAWFAWLGWRVVGWGWASAWLVRRAGVRGVSRSRWSQSRSPVALPSPRRPSFEPRHGEAANLPRFVHPAAVARPRRRPGRLPGSHGAYADEKPSCRMITRSLNATALPGAIFGTLGSRQIVVVKEPRGHFHWLRGFLTLSSSRRMVPSYSGRLARGRCRRYGLARLDWRARSWPRCRRTLSMCWR
jgi:hypothetical protein